MGHTNELSDLLHNSLSLIQYAPLWCQPIFDNNKRIITKSERTLSLVGCKNVKRSLKISVKLSAQWAPLNGITINGII